jgi:hypothetical protein
MDHNFIRHKLSEYLDGTVSAAEKAEVEAHLKACEQCSNALTELKKAIEHVRNIDEIEPPAWMTRKIMARVRAEAKQQVSFSERLYSAFVVKLPVKAVAVVFLAALAFYMYRDIQPQKLSEAPMQVTAAKKEAPPSGIAKSEQNRAKDSLLRSKRLPQTPAYKALDMKPEYEKPAPTVLQDKAAASEPSAAKPFAAPVPAQQEKQDQGYAVHEESHASAAKGAPAPMMGLMAKEEPGTPGMTPAAKAKAFRSDESRAYATEIVLKVNDFDSAQKEIEKAAEAFGGKVIGIAPPADKSQISVSINADKFGKLLLKLTMIGDVKGKVPAPIGREGYLTIRITMIKN